MTLGDLPALLRYARYERMVRAIQRDNAAEALALADARVNNLERKIDAKQHEPEGTVNLRIILGGWSWRTRPLYTWHDACSGHLSGVTIFGVGVMWK